MFEASVNGKTYQIDGSSLATAPLTNKGSEIVEGTIDGKAFKWDVSPDGNGIHVLSNEKSFRMEVVDINKEEKKAIIMVNGNKYEVSIKDQYDRLLKKLGFDKMAGSKQKDIKAPMPGLVLDIMAEVGQEVEKGDAILILEAMKMENVIKSPGEGKVKSISVKKGQAVEKNNILVQFE